MSFNDFYIKDLGNIITGRTPSSAKTLNAFSSINGTPFLTPRDMDGRRLIGSTERYLTNEGLRVVLNAVVPPNSISVSCIGSDMGKAVINSMQSVTNQQINTVIPKDDVVDYLYLYYILSSKQEYLKSIASGSATPILNKTAFGNIQISLPNIKKQQKIAKILGDLDRKIEKNNQINETLEAMAQAIFKSWFVDFDPVKAKVEAKAKGLDDDAINRAAMRVIASKTDIELDEMQAESPAEYANLQTTASHFPDELVESELGMIPKGWEVKRCEDISEKIAMGPFGSNLKVATFVDSGVPIVSGHHLHNYYMLDDDFRYITEEHADKLKNSVVYSEDIIFTHAGTIGQVSMLPRNSMYPRYVISQRQFYLRANKRLISPYYVLYYFKSDQGQHKLLSYASQVGVPSISRPASNLKNMEILVPRKELLNIFDQQVTGIFEICNSRVKENENLIELRDSLLPKLLSGEIEV